MPLTQCSHEFLSLFFLLFSSVSLNKVEKNVKERKQKLVRKVQKAVEKYKYLWVFKVCTNAFVSIDDLTHTYLTQVSNSRNQKLKELRESWQDSRFFFGKNKGNKSQSKPVTILTFSFQ